MKRIITSVALVALAAPLSAMTPSELIEKVRNRIEVHDVRESRHTVQHRPTHQRTKNRHKAAPAKRVRHGQKKQQKKCAHTSGTKRTFHSLSEYRQAHKRHRHAAPAHRRAIQHTKKNHRSVSSKKLGRYVGNGWFVDERGQYDEQYQNNTSDPYLWVPSQVRRQHAYRHYRRQWYLTYLYERSEFDDRHGYHYGYFDRRGFVFDGQFYRYDRSYNYQDRLHGKGLFEHRFYRPIQINARDTYDRVWDGGLGDTRMEFHWRF
jgi:hypothetical protein